MRTVAIIQARMGSTRLPGKMLLPLAGKPLIQRLLERIHRATLLDAMVLAVPSKDLDAFLPCSAAASLYGYPGDESDLVGRYLSAAQAYHADLIVRIPGDNPCVDPAFIDRAIRSYLLRPQLFVSTLMACWTERVFINGLGGEVFSLSRLHWLDQATRGHALYREHPHRLFQDQHLIDSWEHYQRSGDRAKTILLDVNTQEDYDKIAKMYETLYPVNPAFTAADIVAYFQEVLYETSQRG